MNLIPPFKVTMDIYDVLYLSYLIPEERLRPAVPGKIPFAMAYHDKTLISLVLFRSRNVTASVFPLLRFNYDQANIRTYVIDPATKRPAVFFIKSGITSRLVSAVTGFLQIPWQSISMSLSIEHRKNGTSRHVAEGVWGGSFFIDVTSNGKPPSNIEPFQTPGEAVHFLTGPSVGLYGSSGSLIRFEVEHSAIRPAAGIIETIDFPVPVRLGLVTEDELRSPQSVLVAPHGRFSVSMPPSRVYP
ncbi:MAG: hypothetical protein A4E65_03737 [Syntrophorhabdus sp. PtaU1.Bin153]|nr:MAG: hypothetical protein A4E65_03737 [Syntrophorhabdus sp. PtaU1.Bin153]